MRRDANSSYLTPCNKLIPENGPENAVQAMLWLHKAPRGSHYGHLERASNSNGRDEGLEGRGQAEGHWTISIQFTCE